MVTAILQHPDCIKHDMGTGHPECPARVQLIEQAIRQSPIAAGIEFMRAEPARREHLERVHDSNYLDSVWASVPRAGSLAWLDPDTSMNQYSLSAALHAAGAAVQAVDLVMQNRADHVFCNVRPPGHHAEHNRAMGFCIFNNVAVAAAHALSHWSLERVAIVDFDVHHGNGTEDIFQHKSEVLLASSFQHPFYPYSALEGAPGHIVKLPFSAGTAGRAFCEAYADTIIPAVRDFQPYMLLVSAGFDAHRSDPLAQLALTEEDYFWLGQQLVALANACCEGRMVSTLEGGYALDVIGASVEAYIRGVAS